MIIKAPFHPPLQLYEPCLIQQLKGIHIHIFLGSALNWGWSCILSLYCLSGCFTQHSSLWCIIPLFLIFVLAQKVIMWQTWLSISMMRWELERCASLRLRWCPHFGELLVFRNNLQLKFCIDISCPDTTSKRLGTDNYFSIFFSPLLFHDAGTLFKHQHAWSSVHMLLAYCQISCFEGPKPGSWICWTQCLHIYTWINLRGWVFWCPDFF